LQEADFLRSLDDYANLSECPIAAGFRVLGKRWTIEVVHRLFLGDTKFNQLVKNLPGINPRMLALRLKELDEYGLVERVVQTGIPVKIDYSLSQEGMDLIPVMFAMAEFSMKNFPGRVFEDGKSRSTDDVSRELRG
jgi:DNA-binding HxlR family transcriptional regulator